MKNYIFIIILALVAAIVWDRLMKKRFMKKRKDELINNWGQRPNNKYSHEKFQSIGFYYNSIKDPALDIDDLSWSDLDMDQIYLLINNTASSMGEEYLYASLRKPKFKKNKLEELDKLVKYFSNNSEERLKLQLELTNIGKLDKISLFESISRLENLEIKSSLPHYFMVAGFIMSLILIPFKPGLGVFLGFVFLSNNIIRYYRRHAEIDRYLTVFSHIIRSLNGAKKIHELEIGVMDNINEKLNTNQKIFKKFTRGSRILTSKNHSGGLGDILLDYIRMLFHIDLIKFNSMLAFFKQNKEILVEVYEDIGYLDSALAIASFRDMVDFYSEPILMKQSKPFMEVDQVYHPLIKDPVTNSIAVEQSVLVTGSNASGKSTFIKTLAINALLSQTIYTALAKNYRASYFKISSSMALKDDIFNNESYYIVEIKSLKRILDNMDDDIPSLCFIDEVLRGTNTLERISASSKILEELNNNNALIFAATHDIELTYILERIYDNYHFLEQIVDGNILFDYKIHEGRSNSRNAIKLLELLDYPEKLTREAEESARHFLESGKWITI